MLLLQITTAVLGALIGPAAAVVFTGAVFPCVTALVRLASLVAHELLKSRKSFYRRAWAQGWSQESR